MSVENWIRGSAVAVAGVGLVAVLWADAPLGPEPVPPGENQEELRRLREDISWGIQQVEESSLDALDRRHRIDEFLRLNRSTIEREAELNAEEQKRREANWVAPQPPPPVDLVPEDAGIRATRRQVSEALQDAHLQAGDDALLRRVLVDQAIAANKADLDAAEALWRRSDEARQAARIPLEPDSPPLPEQVFISPEDREYSELRSSLAAARTAALEGITDPLVRREAVDRFETEHAAQTARLRALERLIYEQRVALTAEPLPAGDQP